MTNSQTPPTDNHHRPMARTLVRVGIDFALGVALFGVALAILSLGHGPAFAGSTGWTTSVNPNTSGNFIGVPSLLWQMTGRESAIGLLAVTFGAITAFNLLIARQLRAVAGSAPDLEGVEH